MSATDHNLLELGTLEPDDHWVHYPATTTTTAPQLPPVPDVIDETNVTAVLATLDKSRVAIMALARLFAEGKTPDDAVVRELIRTLAVRELIEYGYSRRQKLWVTEGQLYGPRIDDPS